MALISPVQPLIRGGMKNLVLPPKSGDGTPADAVLWLDASSAEYVTLRSSQFVSAWADRSDSGLSASQATEARQPDYAATGIGGKGAVDFEIDDTEFMTVSAAAAIDDLPLNGGFYMLAVIQPESLNNTDYFLDKLGFSPFAGWRFGVGTTGVFELLVNFDGGAGKWRSDASLAVAGTPFIVELSYDGSATTNDPVFRFNGALTGVSEPNTPVGSYASDASYNLTVGGTSGSADYDGMIGEIRMFDRIPTAEEQEALCNAASSKWGIALG